MLLTAGDVHNLQNVVNSIALNSESNHRLHAFGISKSVNQRLVETCAIKGLGQYHISQNGLDLAEKMVSIISNPKPDYTILQSVRLYDQNNIPI